MKKMTTEEAVEKILRLQCEIVGAKYEEVDFKSDDWYMTYTWSKEQCDLFESKLVTMLKETKGMIAALTNLVYYNDKVRRRVAKEWIFNYGWKDEA